LKVFPADDEQRGRPDASQCLPGDGGVHEGHRGRQDQEDP
jgi:hypothetical protein